ncbi:hypothetical protein E4T66_01965 [Sinimarinibacterium sp. CAU 1509]|uniref:hypothetical protein n=1 Tax=Sinimarinibacterium sp. CAU 1509 TaxID=2562283 RepID=UPI0010AD99BE|nr:hypothetical protein [Sinimarinibacterium sp. CAU 1509]TJY65013.1 hypothetical protein E4T66_01965 [Sinimarinibacterium sp. CAU 1509]
MTPPKRGTALAAIAVLCTLVMPAHAADLTELMAQVPPPPEDAVSAMNAMQGEQIVDPAYVEFTQKIADERAAIIELNGGEKPPTIEPIGIDASVPPAVQNIAREFNAYLASNSGKDDPRAALGKRTRWVKKAMGDRQIGITKKLQPCPDPCQNAAVAASNQKLLLQREKILSTELEMWNALFGDWKKKHMPAVVTAQLRLDANADAAQTEAGRAVIARYRAAMLNEISLLFSITDSAIRRAVAIEHGLDGSEPDSISGATRKASTTPPQ